MNKMEYGTFGGGCFWCLDAVFRRLDGVLSSTCGYAGGATGNPSYEEVCTGTTGHAEVIRIAYDRSVIEYQTLLDWFWRCHDPTTLNRQGADVGPQYRSVIFHHDSEQRITAQRSRTEMNESGIYSAPIVTEISPLREFHPAEDIHQDYFRGNPDAPYCSYVIRPKLDKLGFVPSSR